MDGVDKLNKRLSAMTGFTKEWWSCRNSIGILFRSLDLKKPRQTDLITFWRSKEELRKNVHTSYTWRNRGVFRPEEIAYLDNRFQEQTESMDEFIRSLDEPSEELTLHYEDQYREARVAIRHCENSVLSTINARAQILFIANAKKKRDVDLNKRKLGDKLHSITNPVNMMVFMPNSLPGIMATVEGLAPMAPQPQDRLMTLYRGPQDDESAANVIISWNTLISQLPTEED
jgi:hypothetical protein